MIKCVPIFNLRYMSGIGCISFTNSFLDSQLGIKEALFMEQKGESKTAVERVGQLQDEIQGLRYFSERGGKR